MFADRLDAAKQLAERLVTQGIPPGPGTVVLGIPRGGVIVAAPVARALDAALDIIVPRKIGAPGEPELAVGALALAGDEEIVLYDETSVLRLSVEEEYLKAEVGRQRAEIGRRVTAYREGRPPVPLAGRTVLLVDDGIATGLTARAAAAAVLKANPKQLILAAPVAPPETAAEFRSHGLRLEVVETPALFMAVGQFYRDFHAVDDAEVVAALRAAASRSGS